MIRHDGLEPDTDYEVDGVAFRTLPRPGGERLATVATVNDVHFGENECGVIEGLDDRARSSRSEPGETPYPEMMNRGAQSPRSPRIDPTRSWRRATSPRRGTVEEYQQFLDAATAGVRRAAASTSAATTTRYSARRFADRAPVAGRAARRAPGRARHRPSRATTTGQVERRRSSTWLDDLARAADRPVLVFGHHHVWSPESNSGRETYFGINPDDSERLVDVVARRPRSSATSPATPIATACAASAPPATCRGSRWRA